MPVETVEIQSSRRRSWQRWTEQQPNPLAMSSVARSKYSAGPSRPILTSVPFEVEVRVIVRIPGRHPNWVPGTVIAKQSASYLVRLDERPDAELYECFENDLLPWAYGPEIRPRPILGAD